MRVAMEVELQATLTSRLEKENDLQVPASLPRHPLVIIPLGQSPGSLDLLLGSESKSSSLTIRKLVTKLRLFFSLDWSEKNSESSFCNTIGCRQTFPNSFVNFGIQI